MSGSTLNETVQYRWKRLQQIEVEIKLKYKSGKNWGTLTTDRWLQGDRLIQVEVVFLATILEVLLIFTPENGIQCWLFSINTQFSRYSEEVFF